jgi:hypothetical protein
MNADLQVDVITVTWNINVFEPRLIRLADSAVPVVLVIAEGSQPTCAICRNIYTPSDVHYLEPDTPYHFPFANRIYGCGMIECNNRDLRVIHSETESTHSNSESSSSSSSLGDDDILKEFIIIIGSSSA